ncbi:hypothetical protein NW762_012902, partial [Fusarium torreyae]
SSGHIHDFIFKGSQSATPQSTQFGLLSQPSISAVPNSVQDEAGMDGKVGRLTLHTVEKRFHDDQEPSESLMEDDAASNFTEYHA